MKRDAPLYRASLLQAVRDAIKNLGAGSSVAIFARIPEKNLEAIDAAGRTDWLDANMMFEFNRAIDAEMGRATFEHFWQKFAGTSTRIPLIKPIADGAARMFGSARGIVKVMPRSFALVARNLGTMRHQFVGKHEARLHVEGMPVPEAMELFSIANVASVRGAFGLVGADGNAELESCDPIGGTSTIRAWWGAAPAEGDFEAPGDPGGR
jgi:hypothetical protein